MYITENGLVKKDLLGDLSKLNITGNGLVMKGLLGELKRCIHNWKCFYQERTARRRNWKCFSQERPAMEL